MKKLLLIIAVITLTGCTNSSGNINKTNQTSTTSSSIEKSKDLNVDKNDLQEREFVFDKNQECQKYRTEVDKRIQELFTQYGSFDDAWLLEELFYSPKTNSCVYVRYAYNEVMSENDIIEDIFFRKSLYEVGKDAGHIGAIEACDGFDDRSGEIYKKYEEMSEYMINIYEKSLVSCDKFDELIKNQYKSFN